MKKLVMAAFAALAIGAATPVLAADNYLFGYSPSGTQTLTLNGTFSIQASDTGWYSQNGTHDPRNNNYIVGDCTSCFGSAFNDYFIFDLSNYTGGAVTSAVLSIGNGNGYAAGPLSTYSLFDVTSPIANLDVQNGGATTGITIFNDLESGVLYGSRSITNVVQNSQVDTTLNANFVAAINARQGDTFAIGGTLRPGDVIPGNNGVPEPSTWAMLILGFGGVGAVLRRRRPQTASVVA